MNTSIRRFLKEEDGITALEYGLLAALVAAVLVAIFGSDGRLASIFGAIFDKLDGVVSKT
jgi:pilus assembly protein Flp/PilA